MKKLSVNGRRWLLSIHILFAIALLGHVMVDLVFIITAMFTSSTEVFKASYIGISISNMPFAPISAFGTVITGILLCIFTNWGLFKHPWIILKDVLTVPVIVIGAAGLPNWTSKILSLVSAEGLKASQNTFFIINNKELLIGLVIQFILLSIITVISVFKPTRRIKQS